VCGLAQNQSRRGRERGVGAGPGMGLGAGWGCTELAGIKLGSELEHRMDCSGPARTAALSSAFWASFLSGVMSLDVSRIKIGLGVKNMLG
jgi:hypothetical protein